MTRERLVELVERGMSIRQIGDAIKTPSILRECSKHGWTVFLRSGARGYYRCPACAVGRVGEYRRRVKQRIVDEAGGRCVLCGYDVYAGALQFHHVDPSQKRFGLAKAGLTRPLDQVREEAQKCVLLCGNCHAEVEAGLAEVAPPADTPG